MQSMADGVLLIGAFAIAAVAEAAPPRPHVAEGERVDKARGSPAEVWSSELLARRGACDHEELERRTQRRAKVSRRRRRELPSKNPTELSTGRTRCRAPRPPRTAPSPAGSETRECEERADAKKSPVRCGVLNGGISNVIWSGCASLHLCAVNVLCRNSAYDYASSDSLFLVTVCVLVTVRDLLSPETGCQI